MTTPRAALPVAPREALPVICPVPEAVSPPSTVPIISAVPVIAGDAEDADDERYQRDRTKMQKDTDRWLANGKISLAEKSKIVSLYDSSTQISPKDHEWTCAVARRAQAG